MSEETLPAPELTQRLSALLKHSQSCVVFTGAGMSTESGIPDFRSPGGIWSNNQPIEFAEFLASEEMRRESWRRKFSIDASFEQAQPNSGHLAIAQLVETGKVAAVITQNIDGLHQASGITESKIIELHGNGTYAKCLQCQQRYELAPIKAAFLADGSLPVCEDCGGTVKHATISFGQAMPETEMRRAEQASLDCDLFIVIGSSLVVYPAADLPVLARQAGAKLVILNRDPTPLDELAELVINQEIGPTLSALLTQMSVIS